MSVDRCREGERMGSPPAVPGDESPSEILPGLGPQLIEVAAPHIDRHNARGLGNDLRHMQVMAEAGPPGMTDAEHEDESDQRNVEPHPVPERDRVAAEIGADRDLMAEGERDGEIRIEMKKAPGLPGNVPARG